MRRKVMVSVVSLLVLLMLVAALAFWPRAANSPPGGNPPPPSGSPQCRGSARCFEGTVNYVVDGDTLDVDGTRIRLVFVNAPERGQPGYSEAKNFPFVPLPEAEGLGGASPERVEPMAHVPLAHVVISDEHERFVRGIFLPRAPSGGDILEMHSHELMVQDPFCGAEVTDLLAHDGPPNGPLSGQLVQEVVVEPAMFSIDLGLRTLLLDRHPPPVTW